MTEPKYIESGPALPVRGSESAYTEGGISVRQYLAAKAMQSLLSNWNGTGTIDWLTSESYQIADAMLVAGKVPVSPWVRVSERSPERDTSVVYWEIFRRDASRGHLAVADEWRDEHHKEYAEFWLDVPPPVEQTKGEAT